MRLHRRVFIAAALAAISLFAVSAAMPDSGRSRGADLTSEAGGLTGDAAATPFVTTDVDTAAGADASASYQAGGASGALAPAQAVTELRNAKGTPSSLALDASGHLASVSAPAGKTLPNSSSAKATDLPADQANAFLNRYGQAFGLRPGQRVRQIRTEALPGGDRIVRFQQYAGGVPVLGGDLLVTVTPNKGVVAATAETPVGTPVGTQAKISKDAATTAAIKAAAARLGLNSGELTLRDATLWLYDPRVFGAPGRAELRPTWRVTLGQAGAGGDLASVLIDALDGSTALVISEREYAKNRLICDLKNAAVDLDDPTTYDCSDASGGPAIVRREGGAATGVTDTDDAYKYLGATYDFYKNYLGRDSIDGRGLPLRATVRACYIYACPFENAFWDGSQMVFGAGFASADDVIGHELTHGVTDYTSQLLYAYQSGAINEALSDIMGEFIDQTDGLGTDTATTKWQLGEDLPASVGVIRDMESPTLYGQPDSTSNAYWDYDVNYYDNGGVHTNSGVANKAAFLISDGGTLNAVTVTGIGQAKSIQLWYRVMLSITSGTTYADLGHALSTACRRLIGYQSFTTADCVQVDNAVAATQMYLGSTYGHTPADAAECAAAGQSMVDLFYDGMEHPNRNWALSDTYYWAFIPTTGIPYSYARTGVGSLNGWTYGAGGNNATATLTRKVTVPAGTTYLRFDHAMFKYGSASVRVQVNTGSGWVSVPNTSDGIAISSGYISGPFDGYASSRIDLSGYAGSTIQLRFLLGSGSTTTHYVDWYLDNFRIYQCATDVGQVRNLVAALGADKTTAGLSWDAPTYTGPGVDHYEVTVSPAVAGSSVFTVPAGTTALQLTGLDTTKSYKVSVRAIGVDGNPGYGLSAVLTLTPNVDCRANPVVIVDGERQVRPECRTG